jgi:hypothetical protein
VKYAQMLELTLLHGIRENEMEEETKALKKSLYIFLLLMRGNWIFIDFDDCHFCV